MKKTTVGSLQTWSWARVNRSLNAHAEVLNSLPIEYRERYYSLMDEEIRPGVVRGEQKVFEMIVTEAREAGLL
ncbi:MAG TPA: hypothetical protein VGK54_09515 [Chloroflexota bacterium]|jgi:hypothetical protein